MDTTFSLPLRSLKGPDTQVALFIVPSCGDDGEMCNVDDSGVDGVRSGQVQLAGIPLRVVR